MSKKNIRTFSKYSQDAVLLLCSQIKFARRQRKMTELELAERAGISRATLQKIENAEMGCAIGLVFEVATIVGVPLFEADQKKLTRHLDRVFDKLAVLPKYMRKSTQELDDDF